MRTPNLLSVWLLALVLGCTGGVGGNGTAAGNVGPSLVVTPAGSSVPVRRSLAFSATRSGAPVSVQWSVQEPGGGTIDDAGMYRAPSMPGTFHVVATDVSNAAVTAIAAVTVTASMVQVAIAPRNASTAAGGTLQFSATVSGTSTGESTAVTWSVQEMGGGSVDGSGSYTAPASTGTFHVVATSVADPGVQDLATVVVTAAPDVAVSIVPASASTTPGGALTFSARVTGTGAGQSTAVTWSVQEGAAGGSIDAQGRYTAPSGTGTFHVVATSVADPTRKATATVQVAAVPVVTVSVSPDPVTVRVGGSVTFTATVTGLSAGQSSAVTWSVQEGASGGTVNASGQYIAPAAAGTFHVVATSVADGSKSDRATITVIPQISVSVSPATASVRAGGSVQLSATVQGTTAGQSQAVQWTVREGGGGTVDGTGKYTAPGSAGTFHVVATSSADPSRSAQATITVSPPISVVVTPATASLSTGSQATFTATVTGTLSGESTGVTWSVREGGGGSVDGSGRYTAPGSAGTFHVVATSVADSSRSGSATVTVSAPPAITVTVSPANLSLNPGGTATFTATVSGTSSTGVTWSVQEGAAGGSVDGSGHYTAPSTSGTFHVVATSVADTSRRGTASVSVASSSGSLLSPDRLTVWNPGVSGGIPSRTTVCRTVNSPGSADATSLIQAAIDACPAGQVVQLGPGTFTVGSSGNYILINKGITLRGSGPGQTTLQKPNGAQPGNESPGPNPAPVVIIGPARYDSLSSTSVNLTADAVKGDNSVTVASASAFSAGQFVLLDELSGAGWQPDPAGRGQIWASPDFMVVYQRHNPSLGSDDPFPEAFSWFSRADRPITEIKQIDHVSGNTLYFNTPIHIGYRTSHSAQLTTFSYPFVQNAGLEAMKIIGGDDANVRIQWAANSWVKDVENTVWYGEGFALERCFRIEIRETYIHDAAWAQPGGAGYALSLAWGSSEALVENSIILKANKVMVARSSGTASVFGYNYVDDGYINTNTGWIEVGLNASHFVGPHHVLFEGNYGFNWDSDQTHGNSTYLAVFRNHLSGVRRDFTDGGPKRCAGAMYYTYFISFVGNVMGLPGQMGGWVYESGNMDTPSIYKLGWDGQPPYPTDPQVTATAVRHGNFDYVTSSVVWDPNNSVRTLPSSLYLSGRPAFFDAGRGYTWPWVDPTGSTKLYTLPAKARYDNGTPFAQP